MPEIFPDRFCDQLCGEVTCELSAVHAHLHYCCDNINNVNNVT